jgi:hypothetical protein
MAKPAKPEDDDSPAATARRLAMAETRLAQMSKPTLRAVSQAYLDNSIERAIHRFEELEPVARQHGIDPVELFNKHVIEMRTEPDPKNPKVSAVGASGPFQIMPDMRQKLENKSIKDPFLRDADIAAQIIAEGYKGKLSPQARAVAYNAGVGTFRKWGADPTASLSDQAVNYVVYSDYLTPKVAARLKSGKPLTPKVENPDFIPLRFDKDGKVRVSEAEYQKRLAEEQAARARKAAAEAAKKNAPAKTTTTAAPPPAPKRKP